MKLTGQPLVPRRRTPTRPYSRRRGSPPSITTVIDALGIPGLPFASANETAALFLDYPEVLANLDRDAAYDKARRHHKGVWSGRAAMGTLVHAVNEAWSWDEVVDIGDLVHEAANRDKGAVQIWRDREDFIIAEAAGYVDGLERFWNDYEPKWLATEEVIRHPDGPNAFIGQRDGVAELAGLDGRTLVEIKTTAKRGEGEALYPSSWRLQLAAQRMAEEIVEYDAEGNEVATHPNYPVARACVLHLCGDGDYTLYEVRAGGEEYTRFLQLVGLWHWREKESKTPEPLALNVPGLERSLEAIA